MIRRILVIQVNILAFIVVYGIVVFTGTSIVSAQCYAIIDGDGVVIPCPDSDGDGIQNSQDNCPFVVNPDQSDTWGTATGDACENASANNGSGGTSAFLQKDNSYHLWGDCYDDGSGNIQCRKMAELHVCNLPYTIGESAYISSINEDSFQQILVTYLSGTDNQRTYQINMQHIEGSNIGDAFTVTYTNVDCMPPDADGDGVYDNADVCWGNDASGDLDFDGICNDSDTDLDGDGIANDNDRCTGDDSSGDINGDGICNNIDNSDGDSFAGSEDYCPDESGRAGGCNDLATYYVMLGEAGIDYQSINVSGLNDPVEEDNESQCNHSGEIDTEVVIRVDTNPDNEPCDVQLNSFASTDGIFISNDFCVAVYYQVEGCRMWVENRGDDSMGLPEDYGDIRSWCEDTGETMCFVSWETYCQYADDPNVCSYESYDDYKNP